MQPILAAFLGGWEIVLILALLLILIGIPAAIVGIIYLATRHRQPQSAMSPLTTPLPLTVPPPLPPPPGPGQPAGLATGQVKPERPD